MNIHFATTNSGKVKTIQEDLDKYGVVLIQHPLDLIEPRSSDVQEVALEKIKQAYSQIQNPTIVVDAGFYVDDLNGFPGTFVNFSLDSIGLDGILALARDKSRGCEFRECLAYLDESLGEPKYFLSIVRGRLAEAPAGVMQNHLWSTLGLIFIPEGSEKTLAEMSFAEYLEWKETFRKGNSLGQKLYDWIEGNTRKN